MSWGLAVAGVAWADCASARGGTSMVVPIQVPNAIATTKRSAVLRQPGLDAVLGPVILEGAVGLADLLAKIRTGDENLSTNFYKAVLGRLFGVVA